MNTILIILGILAVGAQFTFTFTKLVKSMIEMEITSQMKLKIKSDDVKEAVKEVKSKVAVIKRVKEELSDVKDAIKEVGSQLKDVGQALRERKEVVESSRSKKKASTTKPGHTFSGYKKK